MKKILILLLAALCAVSASGQDKQKMAVYVTGDAEEGIKFVDVRDVAYGHLLVLEKGNVGERYLLCGNDNIRMSEYFKMICEMTGKKPPRFVLPLWMVYPMAWGFKWLLETNRNRALHSLINRKACAA